MSKAKFQTRFWIMAVLVLLSSTLAIAAQPPDNTNAEVNTLAEVPAATGDISVGPDGNIYVANIGPPPSRRGMQIYRVTPEGEVSLFVESDLILRPDGNAFDSQGNLYQTSLLLNQVVRITPEGELSVFLDAGLTVPTGLHFDEDDTMYLANCGARNVLRVTPEGEASVFADGPLFNCPTGITMDNDQNLYVANFSDGRVVKITPDGSVSEFATVPGSNNGHMLFDGEKLYIVSRGSNSVYTLSLEGELELFAGTGEGQRGHDNGPVAGASFSLPFGIDISPDGRTIYLNEAEPITGGGNANFPTLIRAITLNPDAATSPEEE